MKKIRESTDYRMNRNGKDGIKIVRDDTEDACASTKERSSLSIWIDENTRIYKVYKREMFVVQKWVDAHMVYSGVPVFFG